MELTSEKKMYQKLVQKAWADEAFKKALINSPVATIEKFTGEKLNIPEGKTLVVRDLSDTSTIYFDIPSFQSLDDIELSEEQLEEVAGGISGYEDCSCTGDVIGIFKKN